MNKRAGGVAKQTKPDPEAAQKADQPFAILPGTTHTQKPIGEVQIEEDPETGNVRVLESDNEGRALLAKPLDDPLNEVDDNHLATMQFDSLGHVGERGTGTGITKSLEELASMGVSKRPRQQSEREEDWISRLVQKHGDNYSAMFRDRKLNPMQQSEGDIKKRVRKWISRRKSQQAVMET